MAKIFSLFGEIFIENEKANKAIDTTTDKAEKAGQPGGGFGKMLGTAGKIGGVILGGATIAAGALTSMTVSLTETTGAIQDAADRTGMSAEEFQKWSFAAEQSGMSADDLEKAMIKQQKTFADANEGSKVASEAYQRLGIDIENVGSSSEAFDLVMDRLAGMTDETERNALANDIFGKSYADLTPLLSEGGAGMDALKQKAVDLGGVMSNATVASGEQLGDTLDQLKLAGEGLFNSLGTALLPIIQTFVDLLIANLPSIQSMIATIAPVFASFLQQVLPMLMDLAQQLLPIIFKVVEALLPVIIQLMPFFIKIVDALLPPLLQLLDQLLPPLLDLLNIIIPPLTAVIAALAGGIGTTLSGAIEGIMPIITGLMDILGGLITFVTGVFTGDWKKAWTGVKDIFGGIFESFKALVKAPINWIIDRLNNFLSGLNNIKIPDWVPGLGGKGFNIARIPRLEVGLDYVPFDNFPAILHKGERVMTAEENRRGSSGLTVNIGTFINNRKGDIKQLAEELQYYYSDTAAAGGEA